MPFAIWLGTLFTPTTIWSSIMGPEIPFCLWAWRSMHCVSRACTHTQSRRSPGLFGLHRRSRWGNHFWSCELIWMTQSTMSAAVGNFVHQLRTDSKSTQGCGIDRRRIRGSSSRYEPLALQAGKLVQFSFSRTPALTRRLSTAVSHGTSRVQSCYVATRARNRLGSPLIRHRLTAPERTVVTKTSTLCRQCMLWQWARRHAGVLAALVELPDWKTGRQTDADTTRKCVFDSIAKPWSESLLPLIGRFSC